jgi:hypothetical protein
MSAPCVATGCDRFAVAKGLCARCYKRKAANGAPILKPRPSTLERLLRYSRAQPSGCRVWTRYIGPHGYAQIEHEGRLQPAHRVMYILTVGPLEPGAVVDHICRNRACVSPAHLRSATRMENARYAAPQSRGSSRFKGVVVQPQGYIQAYIGENGSTIYLGSFRSEEDAARAYDEAATERYGAFALTNVALGLL